MVNEIDEKIVNEILIPAGVWPISERITYSIAKSEIDYDAFLLLKNKDYDFLGFNLGPKRKIQHQVKRIKNGYLTSSDTFSDSEEEEEADKSNQTMSSSPDADGGAREWKPLEMDEFTRQQMNKHEEYKEKTREYKKAYMRAYRKRNRAKLNEYNRLYNANGRARARQNSLNGEVSNFVIKQERQEVNVTDNTPSSNIVSTTTANLNNYPMISPISPSFIPPIQSTSAYSSIENDAAMRLAAATFLRAFMKADPITAATALPVLQPPSIPIASNAVVDFSQHLAVAAETSVANVAEIVGSECDGRRLRPRIFKKNSTVKNV